MLEIYSKNGELKFQIAEYTYSGAFMGKRAISCIIKTPIPIDFIVGDYCQTKIGAATEIFVLINLPTVKKVASAQSKGDAFQYEIEFVAQSYELEWCLMNDIILHDNGVHYTGLSTWSVYANVTILADRIQANLNRKYTNNFLPLWNIEIDPNVDTDKWDNLSFDNTSAWEALGMFKNNFNLNFTISNRNIVIGSVGKICPHIFEYGYNNGLYEIQRATANSGNIVTRLKVYGGSQNLPKDYDKELLVSESQYIPNLMLPGYPETLIDYIDSPNIPIYGIRESSIIFDDIFPSIKGITAEDVKNAGILIVSEGRLDEIEEAFPVENENDPTFKIRIKDIGFDINNQLTGAPAKIAIADGKLAGLEFEIVKCERVATSTPSQIQIPHYDLTLKRNQDDNYTLPNKYTMASPGDHFVLLDIYMPDLYVRASENKLLRTGREHIANIDHPKVAYAVKVTDIFIKKYPSNEQYLLEGNLLQLSDNDLNINLQNIIIQNVTIKYGGVLPSYEVTLSDQPVVTALGSISHEVQNAQKINETIRKEGEITARRNVLSLTALRNAIFDPDGSITDEFIQTMMLFVGADSMNYQMGVTRYLNGSGTNITFTDTTLTIGPDTLTHWKYGVGNENSSTWLIENTYIKDDLNPNTIYYVAILADRSNLSAEWMVSEEPYNIDAFKQENKYVFNFGVLWNVVSGKREFEETRGQSSIYGDSARFGVISSLDGNSYFDLSRGIIKIGNGIGLTNMVEWPSVQKTILEAKELSEEASTEASQVALVLAQMNDDNIFNLLEKQTIRTQWENINGISSTVATGESGSYGKYLEIGSNVQEINVLKRTYEDLRLFLSSVKLYEDGNTEPFNREQMASFFTAYYNAELIVSDAIQKKYAEEVYDTYKYLYDAIQNGETTIAGGLVLSNLFLVRDGLSSSMDGIRAGMSGMDDDGIAFFANDTDAYRIAVNYVNGKSSIRPNFAVTDLGRLISTDADIEGKITASSGMIGGWAISPDSISAGSTTLGSNGTVSIKGPGSDIDIFSGGLYFFKNSSAKFRQAADYLIGFQIDGYNTGNIQIDNNTKSLFCGIHCDLQSTNIGVNAIGASIHGSTSITTNTKNLYGGLFEKLKVNGLYLNSKTITEAGSTWLNQYDSLIFFNAPSASINHNFFLPAADNLSPGHILIFRRYALGSCTINGNGAKINSNGNLLNSLGYVGNHLVILIFDGTNWLYNYVPAQ